MQFKQYVGLVAAALMMMVAATSCGDSTSKKQTYDTTPAQSDITVDSGQPTPDITVDGQQPADQYVWPDTNQTDTWPQQSDTYAGSPFGCQTDADCFGQTCCPTPWGVKLCAASCTK